MLNHLHYTSAAIVLAVYFAVYGALVLVVWNRRRQARKSPYYYLYLLEREFGKERDGC